MGAEQIPVQEINFHPMSFCDNVGRVFSWRGELYRGIRAPYVAFYRKLFEDGIVRRLVEKKFLVGTELTDLSLPDYPLVVKHRQLPFVSYPNEWCPEMLKDAGLLIIEMMAELAHHGLTLEGVSPWDMLFDDCHPMLVDFCSIIPENPEIDTTHSKMFLEDFHRYFVYPLQITAQGYGSVARWLLAQYEYTEFQKFADFMSCRELRPKMKKLLSAAAKRVPRHLHRAGRIGLKTLRSVWQERHREEKLPRRLQRLRQVLEHVPLPSSGPAERANTKNFSSSFSPADQATQKYLEVKKVLSELRPDTVLDVRCNRGSFVHLATLNGSRVVAVDVDDRRVAECYRFARAKNLPVLPLVMDIRYPSAGQGVGNRVIAPASQRLGCSLVLALSLIHQLVFDEHLTFEQIGEALATFTTKWLLVEFVPWEDPGIVGRPAEPRFPYTLDNFIDSLKRGFRPVATLPSSPGERVLILFERR